MSPEDAAFLNHPLFDQAPNRAQLRPEQIEALPIKKVTPEEMYDLMCEWRFNLIHAYVPPMTPLPGDFGYDLEFRYVCPAEDIDGEA